MKIQSEDREGIETHDLFLRALAVPIVRKKNKKKKKKAQDAENYGGDPAALELSDPLFPTDVAQCICKFCRREGVSIVLIDGPQAWKDPGSDLIYCRRCEKILATPAKTGTVGCVKPATCQAFVNLSISIFAGLIERGARLATNCMLTAPRDGLLVLESFPTSAWRELGIRPLPSKRKARFHDIKTNLKALQKIYRLNISDESTHDQLQALVAGLAGTAILASDHKGYTAYGVPPIKSNGQWVEGYIVNPCPPAESRGVCSFNEFRKSFSSELSSPYLGVDKRSVYPGSKSPAAKELKISCMELLGSDRFLKDVYKLLIEHVRRTEEQKTIRREAADVGQSKKRIKNAQNTIATLDKKIGVLDAQLADLLTIPCRLHLDVARRELEFVYTGLLSLERINASRVHPVLRHEHDVEARKEERRCRTDFRSLLGFKYPVRSLKKKAPQQWLLKRLNQYLLSSFNRAGIAKISNTTRYAVMSALLKAGSLQLAISPTTVKEHVHVPGSRMKKQEPLKSPS